MGNADSLGELQEDEVRKIGELSDEDEENFCPLELRGWIRIDDCLV